MDVSFGGRSHSVLQDKCPGVELLGHRVHGHLPLIFSNSPSRMVGPFYLPPAVGKSSSLPPPGGDILVHFDISFPWIWPHPLLDTLHSLQPGSFLSISHPGSLKNSFNILTISLSDLDPSEHWHLLNSMQEAWKGACCSFRLIVGFVGP